MSILSCAVKRGGLSFLIRKRCLGRKTEKKILILCANSVDTKVAAKFCAVLTRGRVMLLGTGGRQTHDD